jgi:hypothetical protein
MKKLLSQQKGGVFRKKLLRIVAITIIAAITVLSPGNVFASYEEGIHDGSFWFCWTNDKGTVNYQNTGNNAYTVSWNNNGASGFNFTCGKGWQNGSRNRLLYYEGSFDPGNNGYLALYGWTKLPAGSEYEVAEYYVVESYGNWTPPGNGSDVVSLGTMESDGATYNLYRSTRINQPWIKGGNGSFYQYWSIRTPKVQPGNKISGTITFKNHVNAWEKAGLPTGDFSPYYQVMETEGYESKGSSTIRVSGIEENQAPYVRTVNINARYKDDNWNDVYMYIDSANKMNPSSVEAPVEPSDEKAQYELHVLYWEHIDYYHYYEWAPVVALKSLRTGKYVTVSSSDSRVRADSDSISTAQKFHFIEVRGDSSFVSLSNGKSLTKTGRCDGNGVFPDGPFFVSSVY